MSEVLDRLADACGIEPAYHDISGRHHVATPETKRALIEAMGLAAGSDGECRDSLAELDARGNAALGPVIVTREADRIVCRGRLPDGEFAWRLVHRDGETREGRVAIGGGGLELRFAPLPHGRATLELAIGEGVRTEVVMAPQRCVTPGDVGIDRAFGITAQVYSLRDGRDVPSGDYSSLAELARRAGNAGADLVGINPVHAPFPAAHDRPSPYSPSNRAFLDWRLIDPATAPGALPEDLGPPPPSGPFVDWPATIEWRMAALRRAHRRFASQPSDPLRDEFLSFRAAGGEDLREPVPVRRAERELRGPRLVGLAGRVPRAARRRDRPLRRARGGGDLVLRLSAVGRRPAARARPRARLPRRHAARPLPRPRGRRRPGGRGELGDARPRRAAGLRRRAARRPGPRRPELGARAVLAGGAAVGGLRADRQGLRRLDAARRRGPDRPRHGAAAAVLDPPRRLGRRRRLCPLPLPRPARRPRARIRRRRGRW